MIKRFIVWYLKKHNVEFHCKGYVVRMFTERYYDNVIRGNPIENGLTSAQSKYEKEL